MDNTDLTEEEKRRESERRDESEDRRKGERRQSDRRATGRRETSRRKDFCPTCEGELTPTQYCIRCKVKVIKIRPPST